MCIGAAGKQWLDNEEKCAFWIMVQERDEYVFYLSYQTRCRSVGVEYDERIFSAAESNREHAVSGRRVSFELTGAEEYAVPTDVDRCYFLIRFL